MIKRTIEISNKAFLKIDKQQLLISVNSEPPASVPVEDIGLLILDHPAIVLTQSVLTLCAEQNIALVFCGQTHLPEAASLPLFSSHSLHQQVLRQQIAVKPLLLKRLWQQIVSRKISEQADTLSALGISDEKIRFFQHRVKSGDKENYEAQAAQRYWPLLFGLSFVRNHEQSGVNALLNYGYAIIRALVARALVGTGLHPALGIHHHNQYNAFCLADDVMEPFRPWIDHRVYCYVQETDSTEINRQAKTALLKLLVETVSWEDQELPFMSATHHLAKRLKDIYCGKENILIYPSRPNTLA